MTPHSLLAEIAVSCSTLPGRYRSGGAIAYVRAGSRIPDELLPGRYVGNLPPHERETLARLSSGDAQPAPWFLQTIVG